MNTGVVSMRYAKALLAYAKAQKVEDRVYEEVKTLAGHYVSLPDLRRAIENPVLDMQSKCECRLWLYFPSLDDRWRNGNG